MKRLRGFYLSGSFRSPILQNQVKALVTKLLKIKPKNIGMREKKKIVHLSSG